MDILIKIFGEGKDLSVLQMSCRGLVVFLIALVLIRISGRRSFGMRTPLDNIIVITLGAVLSRAIVGVSPFLPIIVTSLVIVLLHRALGWLTIHNKTIAQIIEGKKIVLYSNEKFREENMNNALVSKEDIMLGIRKTALTEDMNKIQAVYMERNGEISAIKKEDE